MMLAAAEAAQDDPAFAADRVGPEAGALFVDIQQAWDGRDRPRLRELIGGDLLVEWERRLDDFDARGWRSRVQVVQEPAVEYVGWSTARPTRRTAPSCASRPAGLWVADARGPAHLHDRPRRPADRVRGVLDAGQARRRLDARLDRAGRRGRPPPHRRDRRLAVVRQPPARRGARRAGRGRRGARGLRARRRGDLRVRRHRARGGARPVAGRRALPARRARGRGAPRGRRVGRGRRRRGRRARARGLARGHRRAALRRRRAAPHAPGGARAAHRARGHRARRRAGAAGAHDGDDRRPRPALPRGSRHGRGGWRARASARRPSRSAGSWPSTVPTRRRGASSESGTASPTATFGP